MAPLSVPNSSWLVFCFCNQIALPIIIMLTNPHTPSNNVVVQTILIYNIVSVHFTHANNFILYCTIKPLHFILYCTSYCILYYILQVKNPIWYCFVHVQVISVLYKLYCTSTSNFILYCASKRFYIVLYKLSHFILCCTCKAILWCSLQVNKTIFTVFYK